MIEIAGLTKVFEAAGGDRVAALKDINLNIEAGEFVALTGPSGSGKTTLLFAIAGMVTPTEGTVKVAGLEISSLSGAERARFRAESLGFVYQTFCLVPYLTALENVCVAGMAQGRGGAESRRDAHEILERVGLADRADHLPGELSGGEQQRVSLARALAGGPAVLLADEPTGNLDGARAEEIMELLAQENRERGQTIVMATHNMKVAEKATRRFALDDGRMVE